MIFRRRLWSTRCRGTASTRTTFGGCNSPMPTSKQMLYIHSNSSSNMEGPKAAAVKVVQKRQQRSLLTSTSTIQTITTTIQSRIGPLTAAVEQAIRPIKPHTPARMVLASLQAWMRRRTALTAITIPVRNDHSDTVSSCQEWRANQTLTNSWVWGKRIINEKNYF